MLIDGKRLQPGDPTLPVADLNFIPPALIERVEVLTGGASATYGSDAIAGVVNFIMKKNYEGLSIDAETSIAEHGNNNQQVRAANTFGVNKHRLPFREVSELHGLGRSTPHSDDHRRRQLARRQRQCRILSRVHVDRRRAGRQP